MISPPLCEVSHPFLGVIPLHRLSKTIDPSHIWHRRRDRWFLVDSVPSSSPTIKMCPSQEKSPKLAQIRFNSFPHNRRLNTGQDQRVCSTHDLLVVDLQQEERVERVLEQAPDPKPRPSGVLGFRQGPARFPGLLREVRIVLSRAGGR